MKTKILLGLIFAAIFGFGFTAFYTELSRENKVVESLDIPQQGNFALGENIKDKTKQSNSSQPDGNVSGVSTVNSSTSSEENTQENNNSDSTNETEDNSSEEKQEENNENEPTENNQNDSGILKDLNIFERLGLNLKFSL